MLACMVSVKSTLQLRHFQEVITEEARRRRDRPQKPTVERSGICVNLSAK